MLGGAPFNVAWHLHALGDQPRFISRVGDDALGKIILGSMNDWGMDTASVQIDPTHQTGRVDIEVIDQEPHYTITPDCAYDFIDSASIASPDNCSVLYHGSLGLRNKVSRNALEKLAHNSGAGIFLDVNLRAPWWQQDEVHHWLNQARWAKLNHDELRLLDFDSGNLENDIARLQSRFELDHVILTRAEQGAIVRDITGELYNIIPDKITNFVDAVGAGDAFTAIYIHGLVSGWPITDTLRIAQGFASKVIGLRGATTTDRGFYRDYIDPNK
ncbi:MAG: PfkB family carbohydrate kinase [Gammaproteobacteria bacterium]